jgi:hypothetical protein
MKHKNFSWAVNLTGILALALAAVQTAILQIGLYNGHPFNPVIALEIMIVALIGIASALLARCLKEIKARLTRIEGERTNPGIALD